MSFLTVFAGALAAGWFFLRKAGEMFSPEPRFAKGMAALEKAGVSEVRSAFAEFGDRRVHYVVVGKGSDDRRPVALFIHGSPGDWTDFTYLLTDRVLRERFRLISMDRPGFGKSGSGDYDGSMAGQAGAALAVLDAELMAGERAIVTGHSLGGPVALKMALDAPSRVSGLVLVAGSADPELEVVRWIQIPASWPVVRAFLPPPIDACNMEILPHKDELVAMQPELRKITHPVIVIQGEQDRLVPPGNADFLERELTHAELDVRRYEDMNHFVPWTYPERIREGILSVADMNDARSD